LPWCSALPSPPHVCTTCCGPSPTFCSRRPFGAVKCKRDAGVVQVSWVGLPPAHPGEPRLPDCCCCSLLPWSIQAKNAHASQGNICSIYSLFLCDTWLKRVRMRDRESILLLLVRVNLHAIVCLCCIKTDPCAHCGILLKKTLNFHQVYFTFFSINPTFHQCW